MFKKFKEIIFYFSYLHLWELAPVELLKISLALGEISAFFGLPGTVSPIFKCLKEMSLKSHLYRHVTPYIKFILNSLFNFIFAFEVLMLKLQTHSNYHFYFEYV